MKTKFCDYIKTAKIGDMFISRDTEDRHILVKLGKKKSETIEICSGNSDSREIVEWDNSDCDRITPINI